LACVVALDTTEAQLAGVERRGRRRGYGRSAKRALARDPTLACKVQKPTKGANKGVWVPGAAQSKVLMTRILAQLRGKTTVKRQGNAVIKIRQLTLIRKFKGLSRPNSKQDPFLVQESGVDYVARSMSRTKEGCTMLKTLDALWIADTYNQSPGIGAKYSPVTKMLFVNLNLTKTLTPRACTTSEKRKDCFLESAHQNCWCKKFSSKGSSKGDTTGDEFLAAAASFSAAYQRGKLENKGTKVQIGESDEVQSRRRSRRRSRSRRKGRRKGNSRRRSRTALQKKNAIAQSKCKRSCIRYDVAKKCEASKGRTQGTMEDELAALSYMKLKTRLLQNGFSKQQVDACPGKPTLMHLWRTAQQQQQPAASTSMQTLDGLMLDTNDGLKTECAIL